MNENERQREAIYRLRIAILDALDAGVYDSEIKGCASDTIFGWHQFGSQEARNCLAVPVTSEGE
jgi:hypothetical protein